MIKKEQQDNAREQLQSLGYKDGETVFYRAIRDGNSRKLSAQFPNNPSELGGLSNEGFNIYVVVNGGGDKDADVVTCKAIFYEHDDLPKEAQLLLWQSLKLPEPTFQVFTGGKSIHSYWVFNEPIAVDQWRALQTDLLNFSDADRTIKNPSRVMRLAGFKHQKTNAVASIISNSGERYSYDELRSIVPLTPEVVKEVKQKQKATPKLKADHSGGADIPLEKCLSKSSRELLWGQSEGGRNQAGAILSRDLIGTASYLDSISIKYAGNARSLFNDFCVACTPSIDTTEADDIWDKAERSNPRPSCPPDAIANILKAWNKKNGNNYVLPEPEDEDDSEDNLDDFTDKKKETAGARALRLAKSATYFHTVDKVAYADIPVDGSRHTYAVRSKPFRLWLSSEFYRDAGSGLSPQVMTDLFPTLEAIAICDGETRAVHLRTAEHQGKLYLDLGTDDWKAVEIDSSGWRVISEPPVRFWRPDSLLALPNPVEGGKLDELKELLSVDQPSWVMIVTFLLFCFCPNKTYPVLVLVAHRGSGKTAAAEILKGLIDPGKAGLIKLQGDTHKLAITATRRHLMVYDNVGHISPDQSDDLCRIATGFGYSTRTLHTTDEETTFEFTRPQIITAIDALVTRDDLADRVLMAQLPAIPDDKRLPQAELNAKVETARPRILGALLNALSQTLAELPHTKTNKLPRMADYALFSIASEKALGLEPDEFMVTFDESREKSRQVVIESSPVGEAIINLMEKTPLVWKGTVSELLKELENHTDDATYRSRYFPKASNILSRHLNRLAPDLKALGIDIKEGIRSNNKETRTIVLEKAIKVSATSATPATNKPEPLQGEIFMVDDI